MMSKIIEELTVLVSAKDISAASYEEKENLINIHINELEKLGVNVVNITAIEGALKFKNNPLSSHTKVIIPKPLDNGLMNANNMLLATGDGVAIPGQRSLKISAEINSLVTATVEFDIGGFIYGDE